MPQKYISHFPGSDNQRRRARQAHSRRSMPAHNQQSNNVSRRVAGVMVSADLAIGVEDRPHWVHGCTCSWALVEAGALVAMGRATPGRDFTADPEFCKKCLALYKHYAKKLTNENNKKGLNVDGQPITQEEKDMAKIENFKSFIDSLVDVYQDSRAQHIRAAKKLEAAQAYVKEVQEHYRNDNSPLAQAEFTVAKQRLREAEDEHRASMRAMNQNHVAKVKELRQQLQEATAAHYRIDPGSIDTNGVALLNSGAMRPADLKAMTDTYAANPTMLRLIAAEAQRQIDTTSRNRRSNQDRSLLTYVAAQYSAEGQGGGKNELAIFDNMVATCRYGLQDNIVIADKMDSHVRSTFDQYRAQMEKAATWAGAIGDAIEDNGKPTTMVHADPGALRHTDPGEQM